MWAGSNRGNDGSAGRRASGDDPYGQVDEENMGEEEFLEEEEEEEESASGAMDLSGTPSWLISAGFHTVLLLLLSLLAAAQIQKPQPEAMLANIEDRKAEVAPSPTEETSPKQFLTDEPNKENPVQIMDKLDFEISDHMETNENMDKNTAKGDEDAISNLPLGSIGIQDVMGVGGGGGGQFGQRDGGGRRNLVSVGGGSPGSENSVESGLKWLADHQEGDGHWDAGKYGGDKQPSHDSAVTGLALLAFLGAGYTDKQGKYAEKVKRGLDWMQQHQGADGSFSKNNYAHGMCTLAAAEAFGMTSARKDMAQRAVDYMIRQQKPGGGWDYGDKGEPGRDRSDTSISCWQVMALKSAKLAELNVPQSAFDNVLKYFRAAGDVGNSTATGMVAYEIVNGKPSKGGMAITAMTMLSCQFLGFNRDNPFSIAGANLLKEQGPQVTDSFNLYYTYYATMTMFQMGQEFFAPWNAGMRDPLVANQVKEQGDNHGSWPPEKDTYGKDGGRVYTTAMACLCLEVYYRYLPVYKNR